MYKDEDEDFVEMSKTKKVKVEKVKKVKEVKKKKDEIAEQFGIFGNAVDYRIYHMTVKDNLIGGAIGFLLVAIVLYIFYQSYIFSALAGIGGIYLGWKIYHGYLYKKRSTTLLLQFKDMLESLSNSYATGKNTPGAFSDCEVDLAQQHGDNAYIVHEMHLVSTGIINNITVEEILQDFAVRSGLDDVQNFVSTFTVCNRLGGNLKEIVSETRNVICDKIDIEQEIITNITEKKNELNIMLIMPIIIIVMLRSLGNASLVNNSFINIIVKTVAIVIFGLAYMLGRKITDIKM